MAVSSGVVSLALLITSVLTGGHWGIVIFMAIATIFFGVRYYQERRRAVGGDDGRP